MNGATIKWKAEVFSSGLTNVCMTVSIETIRKKVKVTSHGLMEGSMLVDGSMANSMEKAHI